MTESTTFWVAVSFTIFWLLAYRPISAAIKGWLDGKVAKIRHDLDAAAELRIEAERLHREAQERYEASVVEAQEMVIVAQNEAISIRATAEADLKHALARREQQALDRIALAEKQALADVQKLTADIAMTAVKSIVRQELDENGKAKLAEAAINDISKVA